MPVRRIVWHRAGAGHYWSSIGIIDRQPSGWWLFALRGERGGILCNRLAGAKEAGLKRIRYLLHLDAMRRYKR